MFNLVNSLIQVQQLGVNLIIDRSKRFVGRFAHNPLKISHLYVENLKTSKSFWNQAKIASLVKYSKYPHIRQYIHKIQSSKRKIHKIQQNLHKYDKTYKNAALNIRNTKLYILSTNKIKRQYSLTLKQPACNEIHLFTTTMHCLVFKSSCLSKTIDTW